MALFKVFRGQRNDLDSVTKVDGHAYFCTDDGSFWIDYLDGEEVKRKQVNDEDLLYNLNLENGEGNGSIQQNTYTIESKNPKATGLGAVAFGGFRGDKPDENPTEDDRTNVAEGIQSAVFGCGNYAGGDWDLVGGKDNTVYSNRALVVGGANVSQAVDFEGNFIEEKTNVGRFNAIFGNNNTFQSFNESNESNLIAGGSNIVDTERSIVVGYSNNVSGAYDAVFGMNNAVNSNRSIIGGEGNIISTGAGHLVSGENNIVGGLYNLVSGQFNKNRGLSSAAIGNTAYVGYNSDGTESPLTPVGAIALGWSRANAIYCLSAGYDTEVNHNYSTALNRKTKTGNYSQTVVGEYNEAKDTTFFEVGNGSASKRKNAFEVLKDGRAKVYGAPTQAEDVVRKTELDAALARIKVLEDALKKFEWLVVD